MEHGYKESFDGLNPVTRRQFLQTGTGVLASGIVFGKPAIPDVQISGVRYDAEVPDTLDLAERGGLLVNALTGAADTTHYYETYHGGHLDQRPPYMSHGGGGPCMPKAVHALPMMRIMSGSTFNRDFDGKMMEAITRDIEGDGLWWLKTEGCFWRAEAYKQDLVWISMSGRLMSALVDWYRYDHDSRWLEIAGRMGQALMKIAIYKDDYATYLDWFTRRGEKKACNGEIYVDGYALGGFIDWYAVSGDKKALAIAEKLAQAIQRPSLWKPSESPTMVSAAEHAHWEGHFHTTATGIVGLARYANVANDPQAKRFVADFYGYTRNFGVSRFGFVPAVIGPVRKNPNGKLQATGIPAEGCSVADMVRLAIMLSDGGFGDYWDDVDQSVRNHLVEHQLASRKLIEKVVAAGPEHKIDPRMETDERVIDRQLGAFVSGSDPTVSYGWWTMCCLGNCSVALYKAWESIIRCHDGIAQVNLLLNRASPWLDVESYLPYEGKVVLKNKTAQKVYVRVPAWVDKQAVKYRVNQKELPRHWVNNYLIVESLAPRDVATLEFPVVETEEKHTEAAFGVEYTCRFKGNTLVDISPRAARPGRATDTSDDGSRFQVNTGYPLYEREYYEAHKTPLKKVKRYASPIII